MKHNLNNDFYKLVNRILSENEPEEYWIQTSDTILLNEGEYVVGFDPERRKFDFILVIDDEPYDFFLSLDDLKRAAQKRITEVELEKC